MWRTLRHLRLSFAAVVCCTLLNCGAAGLEAQDKVGPKLLPEARRVDAPNVGGAVRLAMSFDGKLLAIAGTGDRYEILVGEPKRRVKQPGAVAYLCEADTGKQIAFLELADREDYGGWRPIELAFTPNGKSLVTISNETVQFWDPATGREQFTLPKSETSTDDGHISISPNGKLLAVSRDRVVDIWDIAAQKKTSTISVGRETASAFPDDETLLTVESTDHARLWKLADGQQLCELRKGYFSVGPIEISPDRKLVAVSGGGFKLFEISSEDPRLRQRFMPTDPKTMEGYGRGALRGHHEGGSISFARKKNLLATGGHEGTVRLWNPQNGLPVGILWWPEGGNRAAAVLSPDGESLVVSRGLRGPVGGPSPDRVTEIYPVAELTKPECITRVVLAAAESLFPATEPDPHRRERPHHETVRRAMSVLQGPHAKPAVPLLIEKLKSERVDVRLTALQALHLMAHDATHAKQAVPAIRALANDKSPEVQRAVSHALRELGVP
ncbi:MAG: HEAT repeat domain-containing protein [Planctomycetota bacterium]